MGKCTAFKATISILDIYPSVVLTRLAGVHVDVIGNLWRHMHVQQLLYAVLAVIGSPMIVRLPRLLVHSLVQPCAMARRAMLLLLLWQRRLLLLLLIRQRGCQVFVQLVNGNVIHGHRVRWLLMQFGAFDMRRD